MDRLAVSAARAALVALMTTIGTLLVPDTAFAQYFGQNKVRYDNFQFQVLKTEHFDIYYYDQEKRTIDEAARLAERWYARLSKILGHNLTRRQPLIMYASHPDFEQTTAISGMIGESTGGVTEALRNRIVLPFTASLAETSHVLGHELVHAFQFDMSRGRALRLPLWFIEGMAEFLSLGPVHSHTALWLRDAAIREELPGFEDLENPEFFPYRFGHGAWAYFAGRWGDDVVRELFLGAVETGEPISVLERLTETPIEKLSAQWHTAVLATYENVENVQLTPRGRPLITKDTDGGQLNIGPALSPDGNRIVFLSERELFSIEMFLADAQTGEVIRKLTEIATDPHFDSIQFLQSTGAWAPDNRRFVYTAVKAADPHLIIVDTSTGDQLRDIELDELGEVLNPTWSPDSRYIAFSGLTGGVSDLFMYDLQENQLRQLTKDVFTQIQPKWSPDGRSIALVTDQFSTRVESLDFGNYRLALFDVASGQVRPLPGFEDAKNINPQWSPDGRTVFFLADPNGIPNVFRLDLASRAIDPLTSVATGVTGITETSPALDVAANTGRLAYTLFADGNYSIYTFETDPDSGDPVELTRVNAAVLPPERAAASPIRELLDSPKAGLPPATTDYPVQDYSPSLGLNYVGAAASTGVGASSSFGRFVGGGITFLFSDMLNFHQVTATAEINGGVRDLGGQVGYLNQSTRWNWGGAVQYVPFVAAGFSEALTEIDGEEVIVQQERIFRQTERQFLGVAEYPFNRATRLEFSSGLRSIAFDRELNTAIFSARTGQRLDEFAEDLAAPDTINLAQATGALVYDTSIFGVTSPVLGSRARLEVSPSFGGLQFTEAIADMRHYAVPFRPVTFAARVLHYGRYGTDASDSRLTPLFLGYPHLVRGYETGSFRAEECLVGGTESACPAFDQLIGTRLFVANAELRFPLVGIFQGEFDYGPIPAEGFLFADTGIAWTADNDPSFLDGDRQFVTSAGAGVRVNAFGYLILEFAGVKAFDRPNDSWRFVFNFSPGF